MAFCLAGNLVTESVAFAQRLKIGRKMRTDSSMRKVDIATGD